MNTDRPHAFRTVCAALVVGVLAGCGFPANGSVDRIAPAHVPFGLLATVPPGEVPQPTGPLVDVYFVRHDHLVAVRRHVLGGNVPENSVRLLMAGPLATEANGGLSSDVPTGTRAVSLDLNGSVAVVDLSSEFGAVGGTDQVLAVAQLVYTLTGSRYIDSVVFAINGKRVEVPDGSGSLSSAPKRRTDYPGLLARN